MKPNGTLILKLSPWGEDPEDPRISLKRGQAAEKFFPINGHKFVPKVTQSHIFSFLFNVLFLNRLLMSLYSVPPVETSYGALESRFTILL